MWHLNELLEPSRDVLPEIFVADSLSDFLSHKDDVFPTLIPYSRFVNTAVISILSPVKYWACHSQSRVSDSFSTLNLDFPVNSADVTHGTHLERIVLLYSPLKESVSLYGFVLRDFSDTHMLSSKISSPNMAYEY